MSVFFFFKQKTAYEMRISDWSSDVCSSDLRAAHRRALGAQHRPAPVGHRYDDAELCGAHPRHRGDPARYPQDDPRPARARKIRDADGRRDQSPDGAVGCGDDRSEEHTSELQSLMRNSYAVFCLKKKK